MYRVPHNPQPKYRWPMILMCCYYGFVGFLAILGSCTFFSIMIDSKMLGGNYILSLLWSSVLLLANVSRLGLLVGLLKFYRWAYYGALIIELLTIINLISQFVLHSGLITWPELASGLIGMLILGYLLQPKIKQQFLKST
ncbi:MAG TPA: hypothetical protein DEF47_04585 [Herpetosiphon sp.]|uniref:Uncharacterized protein n=1 Tax=Herpetosiphon aurantiacus (strain ATCC 23779 / DSM 785 / 114-95) TaxID=316274 RepID=A9B313_HERA2|nr:hypothetical protein [Herpetosiphon sp.]ABX07476.1 hypothetical protein Haur_4846 [Herpetosiphon aurantiacus DSM 785]HBW49162.1 hypothetical protein [Herpetosiphon sp.]